MLIQELECQDRIWYSVGVKLVGSRFGSSRLGEGVLQEDFGIVFSLVCLDHCKD